MLSEDLALRLAESAGTWLRARDPAAWLSLAIVVTAADGKHAVMPRREAAGIFAKARELARQKGRTALAEELSQGVDLIKAAPPIEVPVGVFVEKEDGTVEAGVFTLRLPVEKLHGVRKVKVGKA